VGSGQTLHHHNASLPCVEQQGLASMLARPVACLRLVRLIASLLADLEWARRAKQTALPKPLPESLKPTARPVPGNIGILSARLPPLPKDPCPEILLNTRR
jgi:hypothetical protein